MALSHAKHLNQIRSTEVLTIRRGIVGLTGKCLMSEKSLIDSGNLHEKSQKNGINLTADKIFDSDSFTDSKLSLTTFISFLQHSSLQRLQQA